jgi:hypothetical protein
MTISFPITPPSDPKPSSVIWYESNVCAISTSEFTLQSQVQEYDGSGWMIEVAIDPLDRLEAQPWMAFLSALRGRRGTFYFGDTLMASPLGAAGGTPKVNGAGQGGGFTLATDGWPNNTLVLKAGDFIQVDTSLYRVLADATSNGSGAVTLDVWPRVRTHADNADVVTSNCKGLFRLTMDRVPVTNAGRDQKYPISFSAEEAL